jgi:hypothetical protein
MSISLPDSTLLLDGFCRYVGPAPVFETSWDVAVRSESPMPTIHCGLTWYLRTWKSATTLSEPRFTERRQGGTSMVRGFGSITCDGRSPFS